MENNTTQKIVIIAVIINSVLLISVIGFGIVFVKKSPQIKQEVQGELTQPQDSPITVMRKGFIGRQTSAIENAGDEKIITLKGHWSKSEMPNFEVVLPTEKETHKVIVNKETIIRRVTSLGNGKPAQIEEIAFDAFAGDVATVTMLALYENSDNGDGVATSLTIFVFSKK